MRDDRADGWLIFRIPAFLLLAGLIVPIYYNSLKAEWHLDDEPNILLNQRLHIETLSLDSIGKAIFSRKLGRPGLYRPLAYLSFALNWYAGGRDPVGYHLVNIILHTATAWLLYLLCRSLLEIRPGLKESGKETAASTALLAAAIWAINPIQTQAVTYIVQRMAVMAAFFYVLGMLSYVKARTAPGLFQRRFAYGRCCFWFVCGLGAKENVALLPLSLLLVEWIFFQNGGFDFIKRPLFWIVAGVSVLAILVTVLALTGGAPLEYMSRRYSARPFTIWERLLTQPRVLMIYLSQLFYPLPQRLSITHDLALSTSFFHPWTTLPAMIGAMASIVLAALSARRYPLFSVAVLFFFLNHGVESSFFPLELVFEHRNYLPSLLLFLPVAAGLQRVLGYLKNHNHWLLAATVGVLAMTLIGLGLGTHIRNETWATRKSLWIDAVRKSPANYRALFQAGLQFAWDDHPTQEKYDLALLLFERCLNVAPQELKDSDGDRASIWGNMASIFYRTRQYGSAIELFHKSLELNPNYGMARHDLIAALIQVGRLDEALEQSEKLVRQHPFRPDYQSRRGFLLLWSNQYDQALTCFQRALRQGDGTNDLMVNTGAALTKLNQWRNGIWFLNQAARLRPLDPFPRLAMIENRVLAGDREGAERNARKLVTAFPAGSIMAALATIDPRHGRPPLSIEVIRPFIRDALTADLVELGIPD
ncbi:MAG: tetratricopeptide repeat protein [Thermodesulfobacteriota bacterium]